MDEEDFLGVLLDAATDTRLKLLTGDEASAVMMLPGSRGPLAEPGHVLGPDVQAQPPEPDRMPEHAAPVDTPVGADLRHRLRADQDRVQDVTGPPRGGEPHPGPRVPGVGGGHVLCDLAGLLRAQRNGAAHRAQAASGVVAAQDREPRASEGAGDGAGDRLSGVASSVCRSALPSERC
ncbi:hypothetical protein ACFWP3_37935 [Streptomyces sp. NPDC058525]|uniref:hypothetical protein n=1 Tax=Streptomyces sp. NPDC058525 TaxID=3346538 RepID=UPI003669D7ED